MIRLAPLLLLGACQAAPTEVSGLSGNLSAGSDSSPSAVASSDGSTGSGSTTSPGPDSTTDIASSSASGDSSSGMLDSSGGDSDTTSALGSESSAGDSTTGAVSDVGCADGFREALLDEAMFSDIAACGGGFWVAGVDADTPVCDRMGGDDGPFPDGVGCSIDDLCASGWHLCTSRQEVMAAGLANCDTVAWGNQFFATGQSGEGSNACNATGTNDVFGCGDVGYSNISGCAPLNRSTGNLCAGLTGPWLCAEDPYDEVSFLTKPGEDFGGALCCRD